MADLKARRGRIAEAKALYKYAEDVIDGMLGGDDSYWNSSIAAAMSQTYLQHFELVAKEADTAAAFQILERVRGRTLASALEDRKAAPKSGSTEAATLDNYVASTQTRLMQTNSPVEREQLLDALAEYEWRLRLAWNQGDQRFPIDPARLTQVQDSLKSDEVLLEYVLAEPNSFCISVTRTTANLRVLPVGRKEIEKLVQRYVDEIRAKKIGDEEARQLHAFLVQPIPEASTGKRFIVVPDGILNLLPFEALRNSQGQYLLTSAAISYAPSATVLDALRRRDERQESPRPFLGVGDVAYENQGGNGKRIPTSETLRRAVCSQLRRLRRNAAS